MTDSPSAAPICLHFLHAAFGRSMGNLCKVQEVSSEGLGSISGRDDGVDGMREAALQLLAQRFAESVPDQVQLQSPSVALFGNGASDTKKRCVPLQPHVLTCRVPRRKQAAHGAV